MTALFTLPTANTEQHSPGSTALFTLAARAHMARSTQALAAPQGMC